MTPAIRYWIELRARLIKILLAMGVVSLIALCFANSIYQFLALPLLKQLGVHHGLIAISVSAPFWVPMKSAFILSLLITVPFILYQLWSFIAPALYREEKKLIWGLMLFSAGLFYIGLVFCYCVVMPMIFRFLVSIAPSGVEVKPDISAYLDFVTQLSFGFGAMFEVPVVILFLVKTRVVTVAQLSAKRPYVIVGAFIMGMLLTPPDVLSQILLAVPICLLFELGLLISRQIEGKRHDRSFSH